MPLTKMSDPARSLYTLRYDPTRSTTALVKNGELVTEISGDKFQRIYFSIWLGPDSPFDFQPVN